SFPSVAAGSSSMGPLFSDYIDTTKVWDCPSDPNKSGQTNLASVTGSPKDLNNSSYAYRPSLGEITISTEGVASDRGVATGALTGTTTVNHGLEGVNTLFVGGQVKWEGTVGTGASRNLNTTDLLLATWQLLVAN
ncbi:MAG: hypothetical protein PHI59_04735, partial [Candidatus Omnitrophica bacterium]|nr:hypothetical protein [Candidatus Omnitrophota bacterium]